jgi:hypothetical protein
MVRQKIPKENASNRNAARDGNAGGGTGQTPDQQLLHNTIVVAIIAQLSAEVGVWL